MLSLLFINASSGLSVRNRETVRFGEEVGGYGIWIYVRGLKSNHPGLKSGIQGLIITFQSPNTTFRPDIVGFSTGTEPELFGRLSLIARQQEEDRSHCLRLRFLSFYSLCAGVLK